VRSPRPRSTPSKKLIMFVNIEDDDFELENEEE